MSLIAQPTAPAVGAPVAGVHPDEDVQPRAAVRPKRLTRAERMEWLLTFVISAIVFFGLGYHVLSVNHVVVFDAIDRLTGAYMVWWDAPPKMASIGFATPPVQSLVYILPALIKPLATTMIALPLVSALFAGGTLAVVGRLLRRCAVSLPMRLIILVVFAANPLFAFYASNGMSDMIYLFSLILAVDLFVGWYQGEETVYLVGAGLALSLAILTRYGVMSLALMMAFLIAAALVRRGADRDEIEGTLIAYLAPVVYGFALWTLLNALIIGQPFHWLLPSSSALAVNSDQIANNHFSLAALASHVLAVVLGGGPLAIIAIPLLVIAGVAFRDDMALWLAGFIALAIVLIGSQAVIVNDVGSVVLSSALPVELLALAGMAWLNYTAVRLRLLVQLVTIAVLVVAVPLSWHSMLTYPYQNQEQAFVHALQSPDRDLSGTSSRGGYTVGLDSERAMAAYILRHAGRREHAILTDNAQTYAVILLTGRPAIFVDRNQHGQAAWNHLLDSPYGHVRYMLIASQSRSDLIGARYPAAKEGNSSFTPVFTTPRYVLVAVARHAPASKVGGAATATTTTQSAAQTVTSAPSTTSNAASSGATTNGAQP